MQSPPYTDATHVTHRSQFVHLLATLAFACLLQTHLQAFVDDGSDQPKLLQQGRSDTDRERLLGDTLILEGRILQKRGEFVPALRRFQRGWRLTGSKTILKQIIPLALELGRVEEATRYALLLADSDLSDPFLAERLAMLLSDQLEYDRSLQMYQRVLKLRNETGGPRNLIAMQFEMGRLYYLTGKYPQASQVFRIVLQALNANPEDANTAAFRKAISKDPKPVYTLIAESFLEAGEWELATATYRKADQFSPNQQWLTFQLGRVDYHAGRYESAREKLQSYVTQKLRFGGQTPYELLQKTMKQAQEETGIELAEAAETNKTDSSDKPDDQVQKTVFSMFRDWLADDPDNFPLMSYVAEMTRREGILLDAADLYEASLRRAPTQNSFRQLLRIYSNLADSDRLLDTLARIVEQYQDFGDFDAIVGQLVADERLLGEVFQRGRDRLTDSSKVARHVAVACGLLGLRAKKYSVADEFFATLKDEHQEVDLYMTWGLQLLVDEKFDRAAKVLEQGRAVAPNSDVQALVMYYLSGALQLAGRTEEALSVATDVATRAGSIPEFALRRAWILYQADRLKEAQEGYQQWLDQHAEDYSTPGIRDVVRDARFVLSNICTRLGEIDVAVETLEKILDEFPEDAATRNDLGYLLVDHGRSLERATQMIRQAVQQEPENPMYRDSLGWALFRLQRFEEAVAELTKAASDESPDPVILDHLAEAQLAIGKLEDALSTWRRAQSLLGDSHDHQKLREKIEAKFASQVVTNQLETVESP